MKSDSSLCVLFLYLTLIDSNLMEKESLVPINKQQRWEDASEVSWNLWMTKLLWRLYQPGIYCTMFIAGTLVVTARYNKFIEFPINIGVWKSTKAVRFWLKTTWSYTRLNSNERRVLWIFWSKRTGVGRSVPYADPSKRNSVMSYVRRLNITRKELEAFLDLCIIQKVT